MALVARLLLHGMQGLPCLQWRRALAGGRDLDDDLLPLWIRKETEKKKQRKATLPPVVRGRAGKEAGILPTAGAKIQVQWMLVQGACSCDFTSKQRKGE